MALPPNESTPSVMSSSATQHVTPLTIVVDLALCGVFFVFLFGWIKNHVHSTEAFYINFFGASTTLCVTGVFWMAIQMFRIVAAGEKTLKAERLAAGRSS
jgi:hypothetical protein